MRRLATTSGTASGLKVQYCHLDSFFHHPIPGDNFAMIRRFYSDGVHFSPSGAAYVAGAIRYCSENPQQCDVEFSSD